jgi:hypothetical protein
MRRISPVRVFLLPVVFGAAILGTAAVAAAQPVCNSAIGEHLMSWPTQAPVWQLCWLRPSQSSGVNGSGVEIRNVYYNGHLAMKRGHVPILNVQYEAGQCGGANHCYRDWLTSEEDYLVDNVCPPPNTGPDCGYAEPSCPPITVCEQHLGVDVCPAPPDDCGRQCFHGVSAEKLADRLILTSQNRAGWYRYEMKWTFYLDGRIQPTFGFSAVDDNCTDYTHRHHAYWRLDFDIDGPLDDIVTEGPDPAPSGSGGDRGRPGPKPPILVLPTETQRLNNRPNLTWAVTDASTGRGYRIVPGEEKALPADTFSVADVWFLNYHPDELDDSGVIGPACAIKVGKFLNGEPLGNDLVVWYRTGVRHLGFDLDDCHVVGPTLVPIGDWSP